MKKNVASKSNCDQCHGDPHESQGTDVHQNVAVNNFEVQQYFPNPFSNRTTINYSLERQESVSIEIFNLEGKRVKTLVSNKVQGSGVYTIDCDGTNNWGGNVKAGVYIFRFRAGAKIQTVSMMKV